MQYAPHWFVLSEKKNEGREIFACVLQFSKFVNYTYTCNLI